MERLLEPYVHRRIGAAALTASKAHDIRVNFGLVEALLMDAAALQASRYCCMV